MPSRYDDDLRIEMEGGAARRLLKQVLAIWAVAYPILSILPLLSGGTSSTGSTAVGAFASLLVASALFFPWIVGIIVLGVLVLVAPAPMPVIRRRGSPLDRTCPNCGGDIDPNRTWICNRCGEPFAEKPIAQRRSTWSRISRLGYNELPDDEPVAARPPTLDPKRHR